MTPDVDKDDLPVIQVDNHSVLTHAPCPHCGESGNALTSTSQFAVYQCRECDKFSQAPTEQI